MDSPAKHRPPKTCTEAFNGFSDETSLHGFRNAMHSKYASYRRLIWAAILLLAIAGYLYLLTISVQKYYSYTSHTRFTRNYTTSLDFPAVSICEQNVFPRSTLASYQGLEKYIVHYQLNTTHTLTDQELQMSKELLGNISLTDIILSPIWTFEKYYLLCRFDGVPISCREYMTPGMSEESLCFTFQSEEFVEKRGRLQSTRPGYQHGLNILIGIDREEYLVSAGGGIGLKVLIHEPNIYPRVNEEAISVHAGMEAFIGMQKVTERFLGTPYSTIDCVEESLPYMTDHFTLTKYSYEGCMLNCMLKRAFDGCNCSFTTNNQSIPKFCSLIDYFGCIRHKIVEGGSKTDCGCLQPCENIRYNMELSSLYFPSPMYVHMAQEWNWSWQTQEDLHQNVVSIHVYYKALQSSMVEQVASYTADTLIADLGGLLGLFVGASLITLLELAEFLCLLLARSGLGRGKRVHQQVEKQKTGVKMVKTIHQ